MMPTAPNSSVPQDLNAPRPPGPQMPAPPPGGMGMEGGGVTPQSVLQAMAMLTPEELAVIEDPMVGAVLAKLLGPGFDGVFGGGLDDEAMATAGPPQRRGGGLGAIVAG